jgi:hypothetical protein
MINKMYGGTAPRQDGRGAATPLPLGNVPFTTVTAQSLSIPKIPEYVGDSWRPAAASMLSAVPLAVVSAALVGASVILGASGMPRQAALSTAQHGVTVSAGALASARFLGDPDDGGQ